MGRKAWRGGIRGGIAEKRAEAKYKNQSVKKNMNVENRRSKIEERMEGEKVKGRTRKKGCCVPKPYCQSVTCMFAGA